MAIYAWSLASLVGLTCPALAEDCRLALVLALDVSGSVNAREDRLQRDGLAHALLDPEVERAFLGGEPVALYAFEWSAVSAQIDLLHGWQVIRSREDLTRVADTIAGKRRARIHYASTVTALGDALVHASEALEAAPPCRAKTVDVSGDGKNNDGIEPSLVYASQVLDGVTVNALITSTPEPKQTGWTRAEIVAWFEAEVLHGRGAFYVLADGYEDYRRAMRIKLLRELEAPVVSGVPESLSGA